MEIIMRVTESKIMTSKKVRFGEQNKNNKPLLASTFGAAVRSSVSSLA